MMMLPIDPALFQGQPIRPLKRVEYERLAEQGYFDDEKVELLFGMVVEMSPVDPDHMRSIYQLRRALERALGDRAMVLTQNPLAASDVSEPEPDVMVVPNTYAWQGYPVGADLVVEVARSSLRRDQGIKAKLYGFADVAEYWIVNQNDDVVTVYRDRHDGTWRTKTTHARGETLTMLRYPDVAVAVSEILPPAAA